jgi:hypothetical protein
MPISCTPVCCSTTDEDALLVDHLECGTCKVLDSPLTDSRSYRFEHSQCGDGNLTFWHTAVVLIPIQIKYEKTTKKKGLPLLLKFSANAGWDRGENSDELGPAGFGRSLITI